MATKPIVIYIVMIMYADRGALHMQDASHIWHTEDEVEAHKEGENIGPMFPDAKIEITRVEPPPTCTSKEAMLAEMWQMWVRLRQEGRHA